MKEKTEKIEELSRTILRQQQEAEQKDQAWKEEKKHL